jgi:hypothetical protein
MKSNLLNPGNTWVTHRVMLDSKTSLKLLYIFYLDYVTEAIKFILKIHAG